MVLKRIAATGGSATQFGPQDLDKLNAWLSGDADVDTFDINSNTSFRSGRLRKRGTGSPFYYIENTSAIAADRTITEPLLTGNDTRVYEANTATLSNKSMSGSSNTFTNIGDSAIATHTSTKISILSKSLLNSSIGYIDQANTWAGIQKFDVAIKTKPVATPTPDATYGQYYSNSGDSNKPYFLLPNGSAINLSGTGGGTGGTPVVYDTYPSTYTLTTSLSGSPNALWRLVYTGYNVSNPTDTGTAGVRVPSVLPPDSSPRVYFGMNCTGTNTSTTNAQLTLKEGAYLSDFDMTFYMRTKRHTRSVPNTWETAWLLYRFNEQGFPITASSNPVGAHFHHYYLVIHNTGQLEFGRKDNTTQREEQTFLATVNGVVTWSLNTWIKVRIRAVGNWHQIWINDIQRVNVVDDGTVGTRSEQGIGSIPVEAPSIYMYSGKFGPYAEDSECEWSPFTITDLSGGAGAPSSATYVTMATDSNLSAERVLTAGTGITVTDGGAGGAVTLSTKRRILTRLVAEQDIVSTVTETDLLNYSVPASTLGTDKAIKVMILADYLNNSGSGKTFTLKIKYGATTMYSDVSTSFTAAATRRAVRIEFTLFAKNTVLSQGMVGQLNIGTETAATTGVGDLAADDTTMSTFIGANAAENSALGKTLSATITHSASASTISFRRLYAIVEVLD